jgi:hypothetical protein
MGELMKMYGIDEIFNASFNGIIKKIVWIL